MANIIDEQKLIEKITTLDCLLALRNCGRQTAEEVWTFITNLKSAPDYDRGPEVTSSDPSDEYFTELQSIFIPLLNTEISAHTWKALQKIPVNSIRWSVRTQNVINWQRLQSLAEVAEFSPRKWLSFRNFGSTSLTELQECVSETIEQLRSNPDMLDPGDRHLGQKPNHFVKTQSVFIPLLNTRVSAHTWNTLQNSSIRQFTWSVRTQNILLKQGFKTLAEIAELSPQKWLIFRNFGRKSLIEIQETVDKVIANPDVLDPNNDRSNELPQIQTLSELGRVVFQRLQSRQQEIVKYYYGYEEIPKNLQQIGELLGVSRERVRQIKQTINNKINQGEDNHLITTTIFCLLGKSIHDVLAKDGGFCSVESLQEIIHQQLGLGDNEQWIIDWFNEAFGETWIYLGIDEYKIVDGVFLLKSGDPVQNFLAQLTLRLQRYGYRPLTLKECQHLIQKMDGSMYDCDSSSIAFDSDQLINVITSYPSLKVYQYGETLIGSKAWTWFNPEKPTTASLVEWYLRVVNEPATAKAIANGIWRKLGNFRLMPFDIAEICEKQPYLFQVDDNGAYGLSLWKEATKNQQVLTELLSDKPLPIEQIAEVLSLKNLEETTLIVATLNFYTDSFVEVMPFEWALKPQMDRIEMETDFDYTNLTFEDLMPKL